MEFAGGWWWWWWWVVVCACDGDGDGSKDGDYEYHAVIVEFAESVDDVSDGCVWERVIFTTDSIEPWAFDAGFVFVVVVCRCRRWVLG